MQPVQSLQELFRDFWRNLMEGGGGEAEGGMIGDKLGNAHVGSLVM